MYLIAASRIRNSIIIFGLFLALAWTGPVMSAPDKRAESEALTRSLVGLNKAYGKAAPNERPAALQKLIDATVERQALLAELVETDPGAVLRVAIPSRVRNGMPDEVRGFIEQRVELEGELKVFYEDYEDGSHRLRHLLKANGKRFSLHFKSSPDIPLSGASVKLGGLRVDDSIVVESAREDILTLALGGDAVGTANSVTPNPLPNTFGEQHTLVLLVNFQDDSANKPWSVNETWDLVFNTVSGYFDENSYQQTWLTGDVHGWYTLPIDSTNCSSTQIASEARLAAERDGVVFSSYDRYVYLFPRNSGCGWSGQGTVGGNPSESWINGKFELETIGHELGHNFGLQHSHALECGDVTLGPDCVSYEYGDHLDIMGNYTAGHLNAFQKVQLGWLGYGSSPTVTTVLSSTTHALEPFESPGAGPKALKVLRGIDPATGTENWFYLEYRQPLGFDTFLASNSNVLNGVVFHTGTDIDSRSSYQLDMTPASETNGYYDWEDAALEVGQGFHHQESGTNLSTVSADAQGATVQVDFGGPSCVHSNPALHVSPAQSDWVAPATLVTYDVTVTNQDSPVCAASTIGLGAVPPSNWTATFTQQAVLLAPGESVTVALDVASAESALDGFFPVEVTGTHGVDARLSATETVTYIVSLPPEDPDPNTPPIALDDAAVLASKSDTIVIHVLENDTDADGDDLTIVSFADGAKGSVANGGMGTLIYSPAKSFKKDDQFTYTISDGQETATATVVISLDAGTDGGGGGKGKGKPKGS